MLEGYGFVRETEEGLWWFPYWGPVHIERNVNGTLGKKEFQLHAFSNTALQCTKSKLLPFIQHRYLTYSCLDCVCGRFDYFHFRKYTVSFTSALRSVYLMLNVNRQLGNRSDRKVLNMAENHNRLCEGKIGMLIRTVLKRQAGECITPFRRNYIPCMKASDVSTPTANFCKDFCSCLVELHICHCGHCS